MALRTRSQTGMFTQGPPVSPKPMGDGHGSWRLVACYDVDRTVGGQAADERLLIIPSLCLPVVQCVFSW